MLGYARLNQGHISGGINAFFMLYMLYALYASCALLTHLGNVQRSGKSRRTPRIVAAKGNCGQEWTRVREE